MRATIARLALESFVTFTGLVPHDEVCTYLLNADVAVAPDPKTPMNDKLTMAKIPEYMAFALPIVAFDLQETKRIAGEAALYAFPNDPVDFARQVTRLLDSETLRRQLGECGRTRVEDGLNWETDKAALLKAYEAALRTSRAAALSLARQ